MNNTIDIDTAIAEADSKFPALFQLFGGYFHEDWRQEYESPQAAIAEFTREAPPDAVREAASEIDRLLVEGLDDAGLSRLLEAGFGCNYVPEVDGLKPIGWLSQLRNLLAPRAAH